MNEVWDRLDETFRPQIYPQYEDIFQEFTFLYLEEYTDPVV